MLLWIDTVGLRFASSPLYCLDLAVYSYSCGLTLNGLTFDWVKMKMGIVNLKLAWDWSGYELRYANILVIWWCAIHRVNVTGPISWGTVVFIIWQQYAIWNRWKFSRMWHTIIFLISPCHRYVCIYRYKGTMSKQWINVLYMSHTCNAYLPGLPSKPPYKFRNLSQVFHPTGTDMQGARSAPSLEQGWIRDHRRKNI